MRRLAIVHALLLFSVFAHADPVQTWNSQTLDTIRLKRAIDSEAARTSAMVNVAMYDAVNGIISRGPLGLVIGRDPALVSPAGAPVIAAGQTWGDTVGAAVVAARAGDGSAPNETQPAGAGPGVFRADWSGAQYRNLVPFAIADPSV